MANLLLRLRDLNASINGDGQGPLRAYLRLALAVLASVGYRGVPAQPRPRCVGEPANGIGGDDEKGWVLKKDRSQVAN